MKRLTKRNERGVPCPKRTCNKCIEFEDKILIDCSHECEYDIISKLADYEDAEENGLLLKLPSKSVWTIVGQDDPEYAYVLGKGIGNLMVFEVENMIRGIGKYFKTKEEAEAKLKEISR